MKALRVTNWAVHYETAESRRLVRLAWVPTPNGHDSLGYIDLMDHPNGLTHFGVWNLLLQVASKCPERGLLIGGSGPTRRVYDARSIAVLCRVPENAVAEALPRLLAIGWLEEIDYDVTQQSPSELLGAPSKSAGRREGKGREGKGGEGSGPAATRTPAGDKLGWIKTALKRAGLPAQDEAVSEWVNLCHGRAACATQDAALGFIAYAIEQGLKNGIHVQYAKHAAPYADAWAKQGAA